MQYVRSRGLCALFFFFCTLLATSNPTLAFVKGADISWQTEMEANGYRFFDDDGSEPGLHTILKNHGMNAVRLRVWVDPANGWNNLNDTIDKALRAQNAGMQVMIDFHYSDSWADPGKQYVPAAWAGQSFEALMSTVWNYTRDSLATLQNAGVQPTWIQVGNETNDGMLWEHGRASNNMQNYAWLVNSGYDAAKEIFPNVPVIIHLANCHDNANFRWIFDGLVNNGGKFDIIGASAYPTNSGMDWASANEACLSNLNDMVNRYDRDVMVVEVGAPWDDPNAYAIVKDVIDKVKAVQNGRGLGVFYWEPAAQNYAGYTLSAWNPNTAQPTQTLDAFIDQNDTAFVDGRYRITSRFSGKSLDVEGRSSADGANILQWTYGGGTNQQFDIVHLGNGEYRILAAHSGKSLDVYGFSLDNGGDIRQWTWLGGDNQRWRLVQNAEGYWKIQSVLSGKVLDVFGWSSENGANIAQWEDLGGHNQQWSLERIN